MSIDALKDNDHDEKINNGDGFFLENERITVEDLEKVWGMGSMITRCQESHPEDVGTMNDPPVRVVRKVKVVVRDEELTISSNCATLLFKWM